MDILGNRGEALVTKTYLAACVATTLATTLKFASVARLFVYFPLVYPGLQFWRLATNFFFFDSRFSLSWFFNMYFFVRHSASLEHESFHHRRADFVLMWLFGATTLLLLDATFFYASATTARLALPFLGPSLTFMVVYVWSRRNRHVHMSFFGLFVFPAPYLPYVLIGFGFVMGGNVLHDILGLAVGHLYYYFEDVLPRLGGPQVIRTPAFLKRILDPPPVVADAADAAVEERTAVVATAAEAESSRRQRQAPAVPEQTQEKEALEPPPVSPTRAKTVAAPTGPPRLSPSALFAKWREELRHLDVLGESQLHVEKLAQHAAVASTLATTSTAPPLPPQSRATAQSSTQTLVEEGEEDLQRFSTSSTVTITDDDDDEDSSSMTPADRIAMIVSAAFPESPLSSERSQHLMLNETAIKTKPDHQHHSSPSPSPPPPPPPPPPTEQEVTPAVVLSPIPPPPPSPPPPPPSPVIVESPPQPLFRMDSPVGLVQQRQGDAEHSPPPDPVPLRNAKLPSLKGRPLPPLATPKKPSPLANVLVPLRTSPSPSPPPSSPPPPIIPALRLPPSPGSVQTTLAKDDIPEDVHHEPLSKDDYLGASLVDSPIILSDAEEDTVEDETLPEATQADLVAAAQNVQALLQGKNIVAGFAVVLRAQKEAAKMAKLAQDGLSRQAANEALWELREKKQQVTPENTARMVLQWRSSHVPTDFTRLVVADQKRKWMALGHAAETEQTSIADQIADTLLAEMLQEEVATLLKQR